MFPYGAAWAKTSSRARLTSALLDGATDGQRGERIDLNWREQNGRISGEVRMPSIPHGSSTLRSQVARSEPRGPQSRRAWTSRTPTRRAVPDKTHDTVRGRNREDHSLDGCARGRAGRAGCRACGADLRAEPCGAAARRAAWPFEGSTVSNPPLPQLDARRGPSTGQHGSNPALGTISRSDSRGETLLEFAERAGFEPAVGF
jgi:hypothetical protein